MKQLKESSYVCINVPPDTKARIKSKAAKIEKKIGRTYTMIELLNDFGRSNFEPT